MDLSDASDAPHQDRRPEPPVIAIGASAGGVSVLERLVSRLPADLDAAVLVVLHVNPSGTSVLPEIMSRAGPLPARHAVNGERLEVGTIRIAPPDHHLLLVHGRLVVDRGPREHGSRPAVDPLLRAVARSHGRSATGVVLSGALDDGAAGLLAIRRAGGTTIAQDPAEAPFPSMPLAAIAAGAVDLVLGVDAIAAHLAAARPTWVERPTRDEVLPAPEFPPPSSFSCPACGGVLESRIDGHGFEEFRCRTGHRYAVDSLISEQTDTIDQAMWAGYRALREQADLCRRVGERLERTTPGRTHDYRRRAAEADRRADQLHALLATGSPERPA